MFFSIWKLACHEVDEKSFSFFTCGIFILLLFAIKLGWILTFHVSTQIIFNIWWWVQYPWAVARDFSLYWKCVYIMFQSQEILELLWFLFTALRYPLRNKSIKRISGLKKQKETALYAACNI